MKQHIGDRHIQAKYCAVVTCTGPRDEDCGERVPNGNNGQSFPHIKITVRFDDTENLLVMPSTLDDALMPMDVDAYTFTEMENIGNE